MRRAITIGSGVGGAALAYTLVVRGALTLDLGLGRRLRPLGPLHVNVAAPRETVFDIIAEPYLGRTPRALGAKLEVIERGSDMALAAHFTPDRSGVRSPPGQTSSAAIRAVCFASFVRLGSLSSARRREWASFVRRSGREWSGRLGTRFRLLWRRRVGAGRAGVRESAWGVR